jgi:hypothetical protein
MRSRAERLRVASPSRALAACGYTRATPDFDFATSCSIETLRDLAADFRKQALSTEDP